MTELNRENFDAIIRSGKDLILLFYKPNHAASTLAMEQFNSVEQMHGKNFELCSINATLEKEISDACSNIEVPEFISIRNTRIFKRCIGVLYTNQILDLLKK